MSLSYNMRTLINRRGQEATLRKKSSGTYNTSTGSLEGVSSTPYSIMAYFAEFDLGEDTSGSIAMGGRQVLIGPLDLNGSPIPEPDTEDQIVGVGDTVDIKRVQSLYNSGTLVCYICRVSE